MSDSMRYLFTTVMLALSGASLGSCANSPAMLARYQCTSPELIAYLESGLGSWNPGLAGAHLRDVSTADFRKEPLPDFFQNVNLFCRVTIVKTDGTAYPGLIVLTDDYQHVRWISNEEQQKHIADMARRNRDLTLKFYSDQATLAGCDPKIRTHYDPVISQLEQACLPQAYQISLQQSVECDNLRVMLEQLRRERVQACADAAGRRRPL